jgi:hypothetical protein
VTTLVWILLVWWIATPALIVSVLWLLARQRQSRLLRRARPPAPRPSYRPPALRRRPDCGYERTSARGA